LGSEQGVKHQDKRALRIRGRETGLGQNFIPERNSFLKQAAFHR